MFTRNGMSVRNLRLRFASDPVEGGSENENLGEQNEPKFPASTPVKDMTAEQQAAYWQDKARKHEDRVKAYGDVTPEKLTELKEEAENLRKKGLTPSEQAINDAKEAGRAEIRVTLAAERVKSAFEKALSGRTPDASALLDLDRSTFVNGEGADIEKIRAWVLEHSTESGQQKKGGPDLGQGRERGTDTPTKGVGAGADLFDNKRNNKKTNS